MRTGWWHMQAGEIVQVLMSPEGRADPYPYYEAARALGPVAHIDGPFYLVTGYEEANAALRSPAFGKLRADDPNITAEIDEHPSLRSIGLSVLSANPPDHTRMRRLMAAVFTPRRTAGLEPAIDATVDRLLDEMAKEGADGSPVDFMERFAFPLPVSVICELLGVPPQDRPRFRPLAHDLTASLELMSDFSELGPANAATLELEEYFRELTARRRAEPQDDLVSALVQESDDPDGTLSEAELIANLVLLLVAGFETTTNLLGNGLALLFEQPAMAAGLREGRPPVADFVEEVLRFDSPVQLTSRVTYEKDVRLGGVELPMNAEVLLLLGAANRDPRRYTDPGTFDPSRPDVQPLSFGAGAHFCLGSALARLEAATAFRRLLTRFPDLAPAADQIPVRRDRLVLRGYHTLPVVLGS
ncbi:MAG TPA: cytochrome P450 [Actinocrinis sp.]|nr:cytochrome P450 [Actinocrinis sp.]